MSGVRPTYIRALMVSMCSACVASVPAGPASLSAPAAGPPAPGESAAPADALLPRLTCWRGLFLDEPLKGRTERQGRP